MVAHTFNPSTRGVEILLGRERNVRREETGAQYRLSFDGDSCSLKIGRDRITPLQSEDLVEVKGLSSGCLNCFSDPSAFTP